LPVCHISNVLTIIYAMVAGSRSATGRMCITCQVIFQQKLLGISQGVTV